jgi:hypothetical protein
LAGGAVWSCEARSAHWDDTGGNNVNNTRRANIYDNHRSGTETGACFLIHTFTNIFHKVEPPPSSGRGLRLHDGRL